MDPHLFHSRQAQAWTRYRHLSSTEETVNGPGSRLESTQEVRRWLPWVIDEYAIVSMLDAPCGDWNWMKRVPLHGVDCLGWDVETMTISDNNNRFGDRPNVRFVRVNLLSCDIVPRKDLIFCRDFLQHLPNDQIQLVLDKFIASGSRYLITNNYRGATNDVECPEKGHTGACGSVYPWEGYWYRPVNIEAPPFSLKGRMESIVETVNPGEDYSEITQELVLFDLGEMR